MTLVDALGTLKNKGITHLVGLCEDTDIDTYIDNARRCDEDAQRWPEQDWAKYHIEHADNHYILELNGHHIIVTKYDGFDMPTYGDYDADEDMSAAFDEWRIMRDANAIADEMMEKRPGEFPREAWFLIAANELRAAYKVAAEEFKQKNSSTKQEAGV